VAGPIERASHLIHQIYKPLPLSLERFASGIKLFIWGLFLKLFVADNLGAIADPIFASPEKYPSSALIIAAYAFTFQIYGDFAGYSAMARGLARMCGYELSINFNLPYFSSSIKEFWRRWHITLSTWFRDYVYYPLGGNQYGLAQTLRNLMIIFICSGIWHGAGWNFILWGFMHGSLVCLETWWMAKFGKPFIGSVWTRRFITFHLVVLSWIIFRIHDADTMHNYIETLLAWNVGTAADLRDYGGRLLFYLTPLLIIEWLQFKNHSMEADRKWHWLTRSVVYAIIILLILALGSNDGKQFIYFQF
jgi:D-alanyl-lipoteichoic acid acyltransferase DltB (MBOAT superfamily)